VRPRTQIALVLLCAGALALSYALLARFVLHGPVDPMSLAVSVRREAASTDVYATADDPCRRIRPSVWMCIAHDGYDPRHSRSRYVEYRVRIRQGSCWDGHLVNGWPGTSKPHAIRGCVHRWQWRFLFW
jgi:hypothetical protein